MGGSRARWLMGAMGTLMLLCVWPTMPAHAIDDTTPPGAFDIVADAGDFQTGYSVASPYTNIYVSWQTAIDESAVTYEVTVNGQVVRVVTDAVANSTVTKRIEVPDGVSSVIVTAIDASGNRQDATHSLDVVVDKISPVFTSAPRVFLRPGPVTAEGYPMRYTWTGTDEGTGLVAVRFGPNAECCFSASPLLTHFDFTIEPRSQLVWRIWLVDGVGRVVKTPRSAYVDPVPWSSTSHSEQWRRSDDAAALDGDEWVSTKSGDRFKVKAEGKSIGWVTSTGPKRGRADVYMGGRLVDTVNLYSPERRPARVVWAHLLPRTGDTTVTIVNRSPAGRRLIGVDALLVQN